MSSKKKFKAFVVEEHLPLDLMNIELFPAKETEQKVKKDWSLFTNRSRVYEIAVPTKKIV